jgi:hypothetical protein
MHEQKLLEISVTQEGLRGAIAAARAEGRARRPLRSKTTSPRSRRWRKRPSASASPWA